MTLGCRVSNIVSHDVYDKQGERHLGITQLPIPILGASQEKIKELRNYFHSLEIEDHSPDKDVAYFAQKLGISPKRLTNLIRIISGQSAREWIVYYTILEIKSLLRESSLDIKSIAARVNFPDQTTLSRYFRHYTGVTPSQYRKNIYF